MLDSKNLIAAIALSVAILLGFQFFYDAPKREAQVAQQRTEQTQSPGAQPGQPGVPQAAPGAPANRATPAGPRDRQSVLAESPRIRIDTPSLHGSIARVGGRIDDLTMVKYRETIDPGSPEVVLLSPNGTAAPYYAEFGWTPAADSGQAAPNAQTPWSATNDRLTVGTPVVMTWDNGTGLAFTKTIALDANYMFTITQKVENRTGAPVTLYPFGLVKRVGRPPTLDFFILHEGVVGVMRGTLEQIKYGGLEDDGRREFTSTGGWLGITDKYWLAALVPDQAVPMKATAYHWTEGTTDNYQVDYIHTAGITVAPNATAETTNRLFAGAKVVRLLDDYRDNLNLPLFDRAVDFGWLFFLTKPIFHVLLFFQGILGNFGLAILLLTVLVKLLFFPLANRSYKAMAKMKILAPEMKRLQERFKDDRQKMQQEIMALYKREKANPVSGCLPILVQIPVFFALYKVLFVTIEMRHAPFYGWIRDLSAHDPTTVWNLFGLLPWIGAQIGIPSFDLPTFLAAGGLIGLGAWPVLMGISMFLQQKINPQPTDPMQARIFMLMPILFTFMLAQFSAGLVIYWTWNNLLSIAQQWVIMRRAGVKNPAAG